MHGDSYMQKLLDTEVPLNSASFDLSTAVQFPFSLNYFVESTSARFVPGTLLITSNDSTGNSISTMGR